MLHGFGETYHHLYKHFEKHLPDDFGVFAPNGIFPLPQKKFDSPEWKLRFCWYFYDAAKKEYFIDQRYPAEVISNLITQLKLDQNKKMIIGFSQGGYLAPFLGNKLSHVEKCIAINAEYKHLMLPKICPFPLINICGEKDDIVDSANCKNSHQKMIERGNHGDFIEVAEEGHSLGPNLIQAILNYI